MYLSKVKIENFRQFGEGDKCLSLSLDPTLTLIVGENDSGKSTVVDAIRVVLGTSDLDFVRLILDDFHLHVIEDNDGNKKANRADWLRIECRFTDLSTTEAAMFLEWLGVKKENEHEKPEYYLRVWLEATYTRSVDINGRIDIRVRAGPDKDPDGLRFDGQARATLRATYLRPLRDAEHELSARRGSRLSRILYAQLGPEGNDPAGGDRLVDRFRTTNNDIKSDEAVQKPLENLRENYFNNLQLLGGNAVQPEVNITEPRLKNILEQLQLVLSDANDLEENTLHGLGINNLLFMSAELLLLSSLTGFSLPLLLIEEPEAHLHPQLQSRLIRFLQSTEQNKVQVVLTTHSPNLASSVPLEHLVVMKKGRAFPMSPEHTLLEKSDYAHLERFLDVTKANLFFARGVLLVEGYAEQILIPAIARMIQRPLEEYGVTVVNVGHAGLFRYARIFQRKDLQEMGIKVACVADLDVPSDYAKDYPHPPQKTEQDLDLSTIRQTKHDRIGGSGTAVYLSPLWTLEHDICLAPDIAPYMHIAVQLAKSSAVNKDRVFRDAQEEYDGWRQEGLSTKQIAAKIYAPLYKKQVSKPETVQYFSKLIEEQFNALKSNRSIPLQENAIDESSTEFIKFRRSFPTYLAEAIAYVTKPFPEDG